MCEGDREEEIQDPCPVPKLVRKEGRRPAILLGLRDRHQQYWHYQQEGCTYCIHLPSAVLCSTFLCSSVDLLLRTAQLSCLCHQHNLFCSHIIFRTVMLIDDPTVRMTTV